MKLQMKLPINKCVFRDAMRRTRIVRLVFTALGLGLAWFTVTDFTMYAITTAHVPMNLTTYGALAFLFLCDIIIYPFHRKRKWDFFQTLPASKKEWFWSGFLAEVVNLFWYVVVTETAVAVFCSRRWNFRDTTHFLLRPHVQRLVLMMALGIMFLSVVSVIRELTHTTASFLVLFAGAVGGFVATMALLPQAVRAFSGNIVSIHGSVLFRLYLFNRVMGLDETSMEALAAAYDYVAIIGTLILAGGFLYLGSRLTKRSMVEYIGAEHRNKALYRILLTVLGMLPLVLITFSMVIGGKASISSIVLLPVLLALIVFFLCRMFREKPGREVFIHMGMAAVLAGVLTLAAFLYGVCGKSLPAREDIVAIRIDEPYTGMIHKAENITRVYKSLQADIENPPTSRGTNSELRITVFTKTGRKGYYVSVVTEDGPGPEWKHIMADDEGKEIFCAFGREPIVETEFSSYEEYEKFISLLPKDKTEKIPVHYLNALGGMSISSRTVPVAAYDRMDSDTVSFDMTVMNSYSGGVYQSFSVYTEATMYYNEKVYRKARQKMKDYLKENAEASANNMDIILMRYIRPEESDDANGRKAVYSLHGFARSDTLSVMLKQGSNYRLSEEEAKELYDILLGEERELDWNRELTLVSVNIMTVREDSYRESDVYFTFLIQSDRLAGLYERFEKMIQAAREKEQESKSQKEEQEERSAQ